MKVQLWMSLVFSGFLVVTPQTGFSQISFALQGAAQPGPYLIPQTVFVGDQGRLVVPLGPVSPDIQPFIVEKAAGKENLQGGIPGVNKNPDLIIQRIELEHREGHVRLLIDLVAYTPGLVVLPELAIPELQSRGISTAGLQVPIASLLNHEDLVLSEPLSPLAIPGTGLFIYGTSTGILALLLGGIGIRFWGKEHLKDLQERLRRRRLIRAMKRLLGNLRKDLGNEAPGEILSRLSKEFRGLLSLFTGMPCQAMDAGELNVLPRLLPQEPERPDAVKRAEADRSMLSGPFLCRIFRHCDTLRFSGISINQQELLGILEELRGFTDTLDRTDKEQNLRILLPRLKGKGAA
jgi:hypothetical protein